MIHGAALEGRDEARLLRQHDQIREVMLDGRWRTHEQIRVDVADRFGRAWPLTSIARQVRYLRDPGFGGYEVERRRAASRDAGLFEFRVMLGVRDDGWLPTREADQVEPQLLLGR